MAQNLTIRRFTLCTLCCLALLLSTAQASAQRLDFLTGPSNGTPLEIANDYLDGAALSLGLADADLAERAISREYQSAHNGVTHIYFAQRHAGIEVVNGLININIAPDGRVINVGNRFVADLAYRVNATEPTIGAAEAVAAAARHLGLEAPRTRVARDLGGPAREAVFAGSDFSLEDIHAKLMYLPLASGPRLVWDFMIQPDDQHWWQMRVDAVSGRVLHKENRMLSDSYRVYEWPAESPNHVEPGPLPPADGRTVVGTPFAPGTSPAHPTASPAGWHADIETTGNNVSAQTDLDANNAFTPGTDIKPVSPTLDFDFALDLADRPDNYAEAMVTNLFYWNNVVHDILYLHGFDEPSGNFQAVNFQPGGLPGDPVQADAQDGSATNNANFGTPPDGQQPRMQMFLWLAPPTVRVNAPGSIAGDYPATASSFGAVLPEAGINAELLLADDGGGPGTASDACEPLVNNVSGKIVLIDRGTCEFGLKVLNAEQAGAAAAIVANNAGDDLVRMGPGASGETVTISSVFVGQSTGDAIKTGLPGVDVTLSVAGVDRDSDLDNGVIVHEYGHGVSNRLTGGPNQVGCLGHLQQGGEGWSDFLALALTARDGKDGTEARGIGTYLTFEDPVTGRGIRPFPYSTDTAVNPQTYGDLATGTLSVPHGIGSVWATTLWEMYWAIVNGVPELGLAGAGYRQDLYDLSAPLGGNQIALQLVLDGMKFQPCSPSYLDARDGILAADLANFEGANQCHIWYAFAKRGMGVDAHDGFGTLEVINGFGMPLECGGTGQCTSAPSFDGAEGVTSATDGNCALTVHWNAATDNCDSAQVTYSVFRSTDPQFLPDESNRIASSVTGTSYADATAENGVKYYYIVRASDSFGNTDQNTVRRHEKAVGALTPGGSFFDDAGDTAAQQFTPGLSQPNFTIRPTGGVGGSAAYATTESGNYPHDACMTLESDTIYLGSLPTLSFDSQWDIEAAWDGGILEVATEAGNFNDWTKLDTVPYPGIQNPLVSTACPNPGLAAGELVFNGTSGGNFLTIPASLVDFADQAIRVRFVFGSDIEVDDLGWLIDSIGIDDVREAGQCEPQQVNRDPIAVNDATTTDENVPVTIAVLANDSDPDGDPLTVVNISQPGNGEAMITGGGPDNAVTYSPDSGFVGTDAFTYTISDGRGGSASASVSVTVESTNNDPNAVNDFAVTDEDTPVTIAVLANDSDPDGDPLEVSGLSQPAHGSAVINPDGTVTYTPDPGFFGIDAFTYTISDGRGGSSSATVSVDVRAVGDDPEDDGDSDSDSDDADGDGVPNDEDSDDDNDGDSDNSDSDDDGDGVDDDFDTSNKEKQSQRSDSVAGGGSNSYTMRSDDDTLALIALVESPGADLLTVDIHDPSGALLATSVTTPGRALAVAVPGKGGDYTVKVRNQGAGVVDYTVTLIGRVPWPLL